MSQASLTSSNALEQIRRFRMGFSVWLALAVVLSVGAFSFYLVAMTDVTRAWYNFLIGTTIFTGFGLFGLFMLLINNVVSARWHIGFRRIYEVMALTLPVAALLNIVVYLGRHQIYEWVYPEVVAGDLILEGKAGYLDETFLAWRLVIYFVFWIGSAFYLVRNSFKQDESADPKLSLKNKYSSPVILVFFALTSFAYSFDVMMSVEPHWFSTMYGVLYFAMYFQAGLAFTCLVTWFLKKPGYLEGVVNQKHLHDQGKFVFGFSIFWAYIAFSQFMLYWYADLFEETMWYKYRMEEPWGLIGLSVLLLRWVLPFLLLMPFAAKNNPKIVIPVCFLVLYGHWLDSFWNLMPASRVMYGLAVPQESSAFSGYVWQDVASGLGFVALFVLVFGVILQGVRLVPWRDPRLGESIHHH